MGALGSNPDLIQKQMNLFDTDKKPDVEGMMKNPALMNALTDPNVMDAMSVDPATIAEVMKGSAASTNQHNTPTEAVKKPAPFSADQIAGRKIRK